jgi:hypothetical protein
MEINYLDLNNDDFDPELYIKILVAVAKADKNNGQREFDYVADQAKRLGIDFAEAWESTDKTFLISGKDVSRLTAVVIIKDCILLASLDGNFSLAERDKVYTYATKLDITRSDVDYIIEWLGDYDTLEKKWNRLITGDIH